MKYELTPEEQEMENNADQLRSLKGERREKVEDILGRASIGDCEPGKRFMTYIP